MSCIETGSRPSDPACDATSNAFGRGLQPIFCLQLIMSTIQAATVLAATSLLLVFLPFGLSATDAAYAQHMLGRQLYSTGIVWSNSFVHLCICSFI